MKAGRELDALVAEQVLEWTEVCCTKPSEFSAWEVYGIDPNGLDREVPELSTSWLAMREVVEAMQARGWYITMSWYPSGWRVTFWQPGLVRQHVGKAATLPHAVCEAAIAAMAL